MEVGVVGRGRPEYYPALDGLRAVAVAMVFFQHYGAGRAWVFGWGWTGVDVFFVLSGFLITGILYDSQDRPHRFRDFYARRTLRIFPLYYFVWIVVVLLAPWAEWQWSWRWALWPAYLGNYARFLFLHGAGDPYRFDRLTFGPLVRGWFGYPMHLYIGHFWSLCVEEQFYLVWPWVVYAVRRRERLGLVSYGFYVFHDLLHDFYADLAHRVWPGEAYGMTLLLAFGGTVALAGLSYWGLERPFLRLKGRFAGQVHRAPRV